MDFQHVTYRKNADGSKRYYFRRRGYPLKRITADISTIEFAEQYQRFLDDSEGAGELFEQRTMVSHRRHWAAVALKRIATRVASQYRDTENYLSAGDIEAMLERQGDRCALSGLSFRYRRPADVMGRDAFAPSVDRIESSGDYEVGNCRMVLLAVNIALSDWGDDIFLTICNAVARR